MAFQLSSAGLSIQTQKEAFDALMAKLQAAFGNTLNTELESVNGQYGWIMAELRALSQQALLDVYRSFDPNAATGTALDARASLTGSVRKGATKSTIEGLIEFAGVGLVNNGDLINNDDQDSQWAAINGPYADTGGPYPEFVAAQFQAVDTGPLIAPANTNWTIVTVGPNFTGFTNPVEDATIGRNIETDAEFRARRLIELFSAGQGPLDAINAIVSKVDTDNGTVDSVKTYHNPATNPVDADGIPFKAFNVVVETTASPPPLALQQDIFDAILTATGAGGQAYGTDYTGTAVDLEGQVHPISFDLVDNTDFYMLVTIETANFTGSGNGPVIPEAALQMATVIQKAVVAAGQDKKQFNKIGRDVKELDYYGVITKLISDGELSGVDTIQIQLSLVAKVGPYTADYLPITIRQRPDLDSGEVSVNVDGVLVIP